MYIEESLNLILEKINSLEGKINDLTIENKKLKNKIKAQKLIPTALPKFIFIDTENVQSSGFMGVEILTKNDTIYLFKGNNLSDKIFKFLFNTKAKINFIEVNCKLKNALDLELISYFSNLLSHKNKGEFYIISNDCGFDIALKNLRSKKKSKNITIGKAKNILLENKKLFLLEENETLEICEKKVETFKKVQEKINVTTNDIKNNNSKKTLSKCLEQKIIELTNSKNLEKVEVAFNCNKYCDFKTNLKNINPEGYKVNSLKLRNLYISYKISSNAEELLKYEELSEKIGKLVPLNLDAECLKLILTIFLKSKSKEEYSNLLNKNFKKTHETIYKFTKDIFNKEKS